MNKSLYIGRVIAAVASAIVVWLIGLAGIDVTDEEKANFINAFSDGITLLGTVLWGIFYAVIHKYLNKFFNPTDVARQ